MNKATLLIEPTGEIIGLYTELIPLTALGYVTTQRATAVEFNEALQQWQVSEVGRGAVHYSHPSRQRCLEWEHATFSRPRNLRELKTLQPTIP